MQTHQLSIEDFQAHDPEGGRNGRWLCPVPGQCESHTDARKDRSVSMRSDDGRWNCKRCKAQGQLKEFWKEKPEDPLTWKEKRAQEKKRRIERERRMITAPAAPVPSGGMDRKEMAWRSGQMVSIFRSTEALTFLASRGFVGRDFELLHEMGVRFGPEYGRTRGSADKRPWSGEKAIVFPIRDSANRLIATQGRFLEKHEGLPKSMSLGPLSQGVFRSWGADEWPIAIVEAPLDALALSAAGMQAFALCGCRPLPQWLLSLSFSHRFVAAFDADEAGDKQAALTIAELQGVGACCKRLRPEGAKDWAEMLLGQHREGLAAWLEARLGHLPLPMPEESSPLDDPKVKSIVAYLLAPQKAGVL